MTLLAACVWISASVYGDPQPTSSGVWFTGKELTVAMRDDVNFPLGSWVFISYGKRTVTARRTDTGPYKRGRGLDMSKKISDLLKFPGTGQVCVTRID